MTRQYFKIFYVTLLVLVLLITACAQGAAHRSAELTPSVETEPAVTAMETTPAPTVKEEKPEAVKPVSYEKVVFWSKPDSYDIFISDQDGKNQVNLTDCPGDDLVPRLSPNGKKILFTSNRRWDDDNKFDNGWNIFIMDTDGSNVRNITGAETAATMPCWSPDGEMIAFCTAHKSGYKYIWVTDVDGKYFLQLSPKRTTGDVNIAPSWPLWSADGHKMLYTYAETGNYDIWVMDIDYNLLKKIMFEKAKSFYFGEKWSVTGDRKTFSVDMIMAANLVTNSKKLTSASIGINAGATWSPDEKKIAYVCSRKDGTIQVPDIYVMDSDGSNPVNLTNAEAELGVFNDWPAWSPDGKSIAFVSKRNGWKQILKMSPAGTDVSLMIGNDYDIGSPCWGLVPNDVAEKLK